jgi:4-hydroxybenzoate polyprenyltransferase
MAVLNLGFYISLMRIKDWPAYILMALLGFVLSQGYLQSLPNILAFLALLAAYLGFGFSINQCSDVKEDTINPSKKSSGLSDNDNLKNARVFALSLGFIGIWIASYFGIAALLFYASMTLMVFAYSVHPLRLKSRPPLDSISHGIFAGGMIYLLPFFVFGSKITTLDYIITLSLIHISIMLEFANHTSDFKWDKKAGIKTTVTQIGLEKSRRIMIFLAYTCPLYMLGISVHMKSPVIFLPSIIFYAIAYLRYKDSLLAHYIIISYALVVSIYLLQAVGSI